MPRWLHCLLLLDGLHLHCLFRWLLPCLTFLHCLLAPLRKLPRTNHLQHLPRRVLQIGCILLGLPAVLLDLLGLRDLPHLRNWLLPEREQLSGMHHALRHMQRLNHLHHLQHQLLALCHQHLPGLHAALRHLFFIRRVYRLQHWLLPGKRNLLRLHCALRYLHLALSMLGMPIRILFRRYL